MDRMLGVDSRQVAVSLTLGPLSVRRYELMCLLAFLQF